uniref:Ephrin RBD domain-containing protein n=1 Tax=Haemonchus contortus TaxID=6289 RepID=A0A7I4YS54_HAECO
MILHIFCLLLASIDAKKLPDIFWNSTNSLLERYVSIGDSVDIVCPFYEADVDFMDTEQSIIYRVSEADYESCTLSSAARELGRCTAPMRRDKVKVSFRLLSPNPSALDYRPGQSYYFISTSTGTPWGLDNTRGGLCSTNQLKMIIHVGAYGHHHRHHRKPPTSTTTETPPREESEWPADPLWTQFFDKVESVGNSVWSSVTKGERLSLDTGSRRHEYESVPFNDEMEFQIHEIGEVESLFSSTKPYPSMIFATTVLLLALLWT